MSFVEGSAESDFPIQNLPYGIFKHKNSSETPRVGVAIGDQVLDLSVVQDAGLLSPNLTQLNCFHRTCLNHFMAQGKAVWKQARQEITRLLSVDNPTLKNNKDLRAKALIPQKDVEMLLPAEIGDYTDFYASRHHATNVGIMFRGKENALQPNWLHLPVGYHGRSSSVVVSGTNLHRPKGQMSPPDSNVPRFGPSKVIDYEVEMAWFIGPGNNLGEPLTIENVEDHMFGLVILNDWSARDVQKWEYVPLGPFTGKNWGTSISPWVVTFEALEPFRIKGEEQNPTPLPYLQDSQPANYDITILAGIKTQKATKLQITAKTNYKYLYWSMKQQTVHHTITGCNLRPGDLLGSGTISGEEPETYGCLQEKTWGGKNPFKIEETGEERTYIQDYDTVVMTAYCQGNGYRIGFGEVVGTLLPALP